MSDQQHLLDALRDFLSQQSGQTVSIHQARPLAGGASRDSWWLDVSLGEAQRALVMRADTATQMFDEALTREEEFRVMRAAHEAGVKVAPMRYLCTDDRVIGYSFFIMDAMPGISIGRKVVHQPELAAARARLPEQMAEQLALIHRLDAASLPFLRPPHAGLTPAETVVAQTYAILDQLGVKNPAWEWTLRWAKNHAPTPDALTVIHGDFRLGNMLVTEAGLSAVIDWEFAHIGDPNEELAYPCMRDWRFGQGQLRFGGIADRETFLQAYERHSGRTVNRAAVDWWEIMGNIRWGVICLSQANRHLSGEEPSVELASLGRRSAEMQLEALRLIEQTGA